MPAAVVPTGSRWFTDTRTELLVLEDAHTLLRQDLPAGSMPPLHLHRDHDEIFYVLSGRVSVHLPDRSVELGPGEAAFAPRGVPHAYEVGSEEDATVLVSTTSRAFGDFVLETSVAADDDGPAPDGVLPAPAELAAAGARHGIDVLGPPGTLPA